MGIYSLIDGSCLLLIFVLFIRIVTKVAKSERRNMYVNIILAAMVYIAIDVLWGVINDGLLPITIPIPIQKVIYAVSYAAAGVLSYSWFAFAEYIQNSIFHRNAVLKHLFKIPMAFVVVVAFLSIWTGSFFYIGQSGEYVRGDWYVPQLFLTYGYVLFAAVKVIFLMCINREFEKQNTYLILLSYFIFPIIFGVLQIFDLSIPYLCMGILLACLQIYLFNVNYEKERDISTSKIHSLTQLFISSYYMEMKTGKWQYLNLQGEKETGYLTGEFFKDAPKKYIDAIHVYVDKYVHKDDRETYLTMCSPKYIREHLSKENRSYSFVYRQVAGEREKWYRMHIIVAAYTPDGEVSHAVMAVMDIDEQITTDILRQKELEKALAQAEKANRAKSAFLSNMSHDIRTPMNAIIGFTNLAQIHSKNKASVDAYLEKIMSASKHLLSLINDILDMSRIESGKIQLEEDEVSLAEVIKDMDNLIHPMALEKDIHFVIDTDVANNYIYCDKLRLNQVLINLLGNAVKFTPQGGGGFLPYRAGNRRCARWSWKIYFQGERQWHRY